MISFIIATYNSEDTLDDCLQTFEAQDSNEYELHIIDGGSTDNTVKIIKKYNHIVNFWFSEPDKGIYDAWNKGLRIAKSSHIAFIGSDDKLKNQNSISKLNAISKKYSEDLLYGISTVVNNRGEFIRNNGESWQKIKSNFFKGIMQIPHQGMLHKKSVFADEGKFDAKYKISGDYDFLLRALLNGKSIAFTNLDSEIIVREGGISHNYNMRLRSLDEVKSVLEKNSISSVSLRFKLYKYRTKGMYLLSQLLGPTFLGALKKRLISK